MRGCEISVRGDKAVCGAARYDSMICKLRCREEVPANKSTGIVGQCGLRETLRVVDRFGDVSLRKNSVLYVADPATSFNGDYLMRDILT